MDGNFSESTANVQDAGYFKEAVCIDAMRVYDSCSERDCTGWIRPKAPQKIDILTFFCFFS